MKVSQLAVQGLASLGTTIGIFAVIPVFAQDCTVASVATYRVTLDASWSEETMPNQFPSNPHFSGLAGGVHGDGVSFWQPGSLASPGIESMAETGSKFLLLGEVTQAIDDGLALARITGGGVNPSPGSVSVDFNVILDHPRATVVGMIAPSPDWFVGVSGLNLFVDGNWAAEIIVDLYGYDAGTDSGPTYISPNQDTQPPEPAAALDGPLVMNNGVLVPFGQFTFQRLTDSCLDSDVDGVPDEDDNCLAAANSNQVDADGDGFGNRCDADFNNDCIVNAQDLGTLKAAFFSPDPVVDLNADGTVNSVDLGLFKASFFAPPGPSGTTSSCVPISPRELCSANNRPWCTAPSTTENQGSSPSVLQEPIR